MNFLVTGGTGFVGGHLVEYIVRQNHTVTCVVRDRSRLGSLNESVPLLTYDELWTYSGKFDCLIHAAGATRAATWDEYYKSNVGLTKDLLEFSIKTGVSRFVLVSSQAAVGPSPDSGLPVDECCSPSPIIDYGKSKHEAEKLTCRYADRIPVTVVRPCVVFGPGDRDVLGVFKTARLGLVPCLGGPDRLISVIYVKDLVAGIFAAAVTPEAEGKTYFLANPEPVVWREFCSRVAKNMGKKPILLPFPLWFMRILTGMGDLVGRFGSRPPLLRGEKYAEMKQIAWVCSPDRAMKELNWSPDTPLDTAIRETADWYVAHGWL
jgi:dihydroflavonol-4-reductase